ncbi:MAG: GtrA family protein [Bacilli bacterium]|nr:GtrA family protein [Bacilli bacterium]
MILVILGTQDKEFPRLLDAVQDLINRGIIHERVVVQAGQTKYQSDSMEIFDLLPAPEFDQLLNDADLIITHGGVGSILAAIKKGKKIIATPRLAKYKEHHNDHQKQIIKEFADKGYLLELRDFSKLDKMIEKSKNFKPKKFQSHTSNMIQMLEDYMEEDHHVSWFNRFYEGLSYLFFGFCTTLINLIAFYIFRKMNIDLYISNGISWIISVLFAYITNRLFVFHSKGKVIKEGFSFLFFRILSLVFDMAFLFLFVDIFHISDIISKIIVNILIIIINYVFSKIFIFRGGEK